MRFTPLLLTFALASAASAQAEWEFRLSSDTVTPQEPSVTVTLAVSFPATDFAFAGANWNAHASEAGWTDPVQIPLQSGVACVACAGHVEGPDVRGISHAQLYNFGFVPDPSNPVELWRDTFTVTDFSAARQIDLSTTTSRFEVYPEDLGPGMSPTEPRAVTEGHAVIQVIPAPAPLALLGFGALAAGRRRRR